MKLALKYGLVIAAGLIAWVLIAHWLVPNPRSLVHTFVAPIFFNLLHFTVLFLGLKAFERESGSKMTFKEGMKTGVSISFVYAVTAALFFVGVLIVIGDKWLNAEPDALQMAPWLVVLRAFTGLVAVTMILGTIYSALISFVLARRLSSEA
jgi:Protein of unknown function (DUF4199)